MNSIFPVLTKQVYALPIYVHSIGIQPKQNEITRQSGQLKYQIAYCLNGSGYIDVGNQRRDIKEGDVFYLPKGLAHTYGPIEENFVIKWVIFDGELVTDINDLLGYKAFMSWHLNDMGKLEVFFQEIYDQLLSQKDEFQHRVSAKIYELLLFLKEERERPSIRVNKTKSEPMVAFIEAHYKEDISLDRIAHTIDRSVFHACKIFKRDMNTTMLKYLEDIRMKHAKSLLLLDEYSNIETLAHQVGYQSSNYFCRVFKKNEGLTPIQFRVCMRGSTRYT